MAASNLDSALQVYDAFNRRDLDAAVSVFADDGVLNEMGGQGRRLEGREAIKGYFSAFVAASSDWKATVVNAYESENVVVVQAVASGTNDGPLGPFPPTGRQATLPFCEIWEFNSQGQAIRNDEYYDQLSILAQLGHVQPPA
jgi:steroid delta-isomerase-like uncharacterized protein